MHEYLIEFADGSSLEVSVAPDADLDGSFTATCNFTGEALTINGWLATRFEPLDLVEA
tara:strand:+ start:426 stop:599 length:174 start_codon:yes stop_codon:yes gene_type:complete